MPDELNARVDEKIATLEQINALYKKLDALDEPEVSKTVDPDATGDISFTWNVEGGTPVSASLPDNTVVTLDAHDHPEHDHKTIYAAPDSNDTGILKSIIAKFQHGMKPGQGVFKAADGKRLMLIVTSNSYQDRDGETLTSEALKEDVNRHWTPGDDEYMTSNKLLFWHDDAIPVGDIIWGDMIGPFYAELAREGSDLVAKRYFDYREAHPDEKWGASHRFAYYTPHRTEGGDYQRIYKQETTTLPLDAAANLITMSEVFPMSDKRSKKFDDIMGFTGAYDLIKTEGFDALRKKLAEQGVEHKSVDGEPAFNPDAVSTMAKAFVEMVADAEEQDKAVIDAVEKLDSATKAFDAKVAELDTALKSVQEKQEALDVQLSQKPRSASRADETIVEGRMEKELEASLHPKHPTFGVPYQAGA